jgi:hypothetical protein
VGLFVFNGLTSVSFRRFRALFVFDDLAHIRVSPLRGACVSPPDAENVIAPRHEKCELAYLIFLKNNSKLGPAWQEIVA